MILTTIYVRCDEPTCGRVAKLDRQNSGGLNVSYALDVLARQGWQTGTTKTPQRCPQHRERHPGYHEFVPGTGDKSSCSFTSDKPSGRRWCWRPAEHYIHAEGPVAS